MSLISPEQLPSTYHPAENDSEKHSHCSQKRDRPTARSLQQHRSETRTFFYRTRYRGRHLYLDRYNYGRVGPICRLTYTDDIGNWEFAIYKYSKERYDPDKWFFPGAENIAGTVDGAMEAWLKAYPPRI